MYSRNHEGCLHFQRQCNHISHGKKTMRMVDHDSQLSKLFAAQDACAHNAGDGEYLPSLTGADPSTFPLASVSVTVPVGAVAANRHALRLSIAYTDCQTHQ